jgi:hypothetical protein
MTGSRGQGFLAKDYQLNTVGDRCEPDTIVPLARLEVPPKERLASTDALVLWPSDGGNQ